MRSKRAITATALAATFMAGAARAEEPKPTAPATKTFTSVYGELPLPDGCQPGVSWLRQVGPVNLTLPKGQGAPGMEFIGAMGVGRIAVTLPSKQVAYLILPTKAPLAGKRPWVLYAPAEMGDTWIWQRLLDNGFAIAGVPGVAEWMGKPEARAVVTELYDRLTKEFGLDKQVCLMPQSRGGLLCYNWAAENPEKVRCIGGIYPVGDITLFTWGNGLAGTSKTYGLSEEEMQAQFPRHNPVERLAPLADKKIAILHVTGDKDGAVPAEKNSLEIQRRYRALGGEMEVDVIPGKGHQECPEIFHSQKLVDFFIKHGL